MSDLRKDAEFDLEEKIVEEIEDKKRLKGEILRDTGWLLKKTGAIEEK